jgi:5-methylcytosine-specific restriction protein B
MMERYKALKSAGRIEFVTFHQSFGYEDFVEGLRPQTGADDEDEGAANSGGFRLRPEPGIFKRISSVAEQSGARARRRGTFDLAGRHFYKMSLGRASDQSEVYKAALEGGYIALGWGGENDWSDPKYSNWTQILEKWRETKPDISPNSGDVAQVYTLRGEMKPGDIIIVPDGNTKFRAIGEVTGDYEYVPAPEGFRHRRPVRWLRVFDKSLPVDLILDGRFSMMSLHRLDADRLKLQALENLLGSEAEGSEPTGEPEPYVLIIDEINRANISKVFGELITLLEPDKRLGCQNELRVTLPYSKEEFGVPANLHVIGTMNTADRSIALLDTALRRRFRFEELMPEPAKLQEASTSTGVNLVSVLAKLNERIEYFFDREHQIGHAYFMPRMTRADVDEVMRTKVIPLLTEYFYESWEKVWQVLGEPEANDEGAFLRRRKLNTPVGAETFGQDRWRFDIKPEFGASAYDQFS